MSDLESRVKDAISWKKLPWGGQDKFVQLDANATHAVWGHIAPLLDAAIAEAQAEALREAADTMDADPEFRDPLRLKSDWLRARADKLATE